MSQPSFDFAEVLHRMVESRASDVHLTAGFPPAMRDKGKIVPMEGFARLTPQDTREVIFGILNDDQRKRFENDKQLDFAYAIPERRPLPRQLLHAARLGQRRLPPGPARGALASTRSACRRCCAT